MTIINNICESISQKKNLPEEIVRAAYCFENYHGMDSDAWDADIRNSQFTPEAIHQLKVEIKEFIEKYQNNEFIGTAIWAFGKISDISDKEFLRKLLDLYLDKNPQVLYQIMCALDNIGEKIFIEPSSIIDDDKNAFLAKQYLNY